MTASEPPCQDWPASKQTSCAIIPPAVASSSTCTASNEKRRALEMFTVCMTWPPSSRGRPRDRCRVLPGVSADCRVHRLGRSKSVPDASPHVPAMLWISVSIDRAVHGLVGPLWQCQIRRNPVTDANLGYPHDIVPSWSAFRRVLHRPAENRHYLWITWEARLRR